MNNITRIVKTFKELYKIQNSNVELEARLGYYRGHFVTDVGQQMFERIRLWLEKSDYVSDIEKIEYNDYTYVHEGKKLRTRVIFDTLNMEMKRHTITKNKIMDVTLQEHGPQEMCVRIQVSEENEVMGTLPSVVETEYVRVVQRYSYTVGSWRYDFSRVAEGATRMEAEDNKRVGNFHYEIECELIDPAYIENKSELHIAKSILCKMTDITQCNWNISE